MRFTNHVYKGDLVGTRKLVSKNVPDLLIVYKTVNSVKTLFKKHLYLFSFGHTLRHVGS